MGMKSSVVKNLNPAPTLSWKNGTPGNRWTDGDVVNAAHNSVVFIYSGESMDPVTINLPVITPESAGQRIQVINVLNIKEFPGDTILVLGDPDEFMESQSGLDFPDGFMPDTGNLHKCHFWLVSDGVERWSFHYPDAGLSQLIAV